ncbi:MAG TPA: 4'-phosphopantetheinyl transferase superfamily protein [Pedobacter sp.]|nr:4'-phosphopantetheinyl transferase superfamily protein [Pedobacter sp.]
MIGNDIVDLLQAAKDSDWQRKGFLDKLFTSEEQFLISSDIHPPLMVWLLWSMKESAYKINSRETKLRLFAPVKLVCNNLIIHDNKATGNVTYEGRLYYTESEISVNYIHTLAADVPEEIERAKVSIMDFHTDYKSSNPQSVSHHGRYLALAYL